MARRLSGGRRCDSHADQSLRRLFVADERAQHNAVVVEPREQTKGGFVVRHGARVQPVVDRLHHRGSLTRRQHRAAQELYEAWALGVMGARDKEAAGCGAWQPAGYADAQLVALTRYREAHQRLGTRLFALAYAVCIDDVPVSKWAAEHGENTNAQSAVLRVALDMLADLWGLHEGD